MLINLNTNVFLNNISLLALFFNKIILYYLSYLIFNFFGEMKSEIQRGDRTYSEDHSDKRLYLYSYQILLSPGSVPILTYILHYSSSDVHLL